MTNTARATVSQSEALHADAPKSLFQPEPANPMAALGGVVTLGAVSASTGLLGAVMMGMSIFGFQCEPDAALLATAQDEKAPEESFEYVETRFVKLGTTYRKRALPTKLKVGGAPAPGGGAREPGLRRQVADAGVEGEGTSNILDALAGRAGDVAGEGKAKRGVGSPDGISSGTATEEDGDIYRGKLYVFFRRGFTLPPSLSRDEAKGLRATVRVTISENGRVESYTLGSSGNREFDQAVRLRMEQALGSKLPEPPPEVRSDFFGRTLPVGFTPPR